MNIQRFKFICILPLLIAISQTSYADNKNPFKAIGIQNPLEIEAFFSSLQKDVRENNIEGISNKIVYPLTVRIYDKKVVLNDISDLQKNFNRIFNDDVKAAILCQKYSDLGAQWRGIMVGRGTIWISMRFLKDESKFDEEKDSDFTDRTLWKICITQINYSDITKAFVENCKKGK